jgi:RNA recognition motif-containing protein
MYLCTVLAALVQEKAGRAIFLRYVLRVDGMMSSDASKICFLRGLDNSVSDREVRDVFGRYGDLLDVDLKLNKGYGFIEYSHPSAVDEAIRCENGRPLRGLTLVVERKNARATVYVRLEYRNDSSEHKEEGRAVHQILDLQQGHERWKTCVWYLLVNLSSDWL